MQNTDVENGSPKMSQTRGFARVANKIGRDVDKTTTIYRRFDELSARNLLYYQAEIAELEERQRELDAADWKAKDEVSISCQSDWYEFSKHAEGAGGTIRKRESEKMGLAMRIREKIEKYHTALANHQVLLNAPTPSKNTIKAMRNWFFHNTSSDKNIPEYPHLWGASSTIYSNSEDLIALRVPANQDRLSEFIQSNFALFFRTKDYDLDGRTAYISERSIGQFVAILSTLLAAVLLFGAIISLYLLKNERAILGMLSAWTIIFASCVGLLTNARRDQIFAATAAYAAVLVVFVSGDIGGKGSCTCTASVG